MTTSNAGPAPHIHWHRTDRYTRIALYSYTMLSCPPFGAIPVAGEKGSESVCPSPHHPKPDPPFLTSGRAETGPIAAISCMTVAFFLHLRMWREDRNGGQCKDDKDDKVGRRGSHRLMPCA